MRYTPPESLTTERTFSMRAGLLASTVTPGSTAPDESRTTPLIEACAKASDGTRATHTIAHVAKRSALRITVSWKMAELANSSLPQQGGQSPNQGGWARGGEHTGRLVTQSRACTSLSRRTRRVRLYNTGWGTPSA